MTLFMTEIALADWPAGLAWYRDVLGLPVLMVDEAHRFALLGGEGGRLALVGGEAGSRSEGPRLVFLVDDLEGTRGKLVAAGVSAGEIVASAREPYRSVRVTGPEGASIRLFEWAEG